MACLRNIKVELTTYMASMIAVAVVCTKDRTAPAVVPHFLEGNRFQWRFVLVYERSKNSVPVSLLDMAGWISIAFCLFKRKVLFSRTSFLQLLEDHHIMCGVIEHLS